MKQNNVKESQINSRIHFSEHRLDVVALKVFSVSKVSRKTIIFIFTLKSCFCVFFLFFGSRIICCISKSACSESDICYTPKRKYWIHCKMVFRVHVYQTIWNEEKKTQKKRKMKMQFIYIFFIVPFSFICVHCLYELYFIH